MKFGKEFKTHLEETLPEWRDKYLCYKLLKKVLKHIPNSSTTADSAALNLPPSDGDDVSAPLAELQDWFIKILNDELEKFNDFYVDKEEEFIIRLQVFSHLKTSSAPFVLLFFRSYIYLIFYQFNFCNLIVLTFSALECVLYFKVISVTFSRFGFLLPLSLSLSQKYAQNLLQDEEYGISL